MRNYFKYILLVVVSLCVLDVYADVTPRFAGLANDEYYMELLHSAESNSLYQKSLIESLANNKSLYEKGEGDLSKYRSQIVEDEQKLIDLRVELSAILKEINLIEQQWSLNNLQSDSSLSKASTSTIVIVSDTEARTIAQSRFAIEKLPSDDLDNLCDAEADMAKLTLLINSYVSNYGELARLKQEHEQASTKIVADSVQLVYDRVDSLSSIVATKISTKWGKISESQGFAYALLMETAGREDFYDIEERLKVEAVENANELVDNVQSVELLDCHFSKLSMLKLGVEVAQYLQLPKVLDSLQSVRDSMLMVEFNFPSVKLEERYFIDYEPIQFSTKPKYTSANPIPKGVVYERGVIYRLLVGRFKTRQAATLFKGAYPISIIENEQKLLCYYIGGYQTLEEAEQAREVLLKRGFKRPEVVEWRDGNVRNITHEQQSGVVSNSGAKFRVEISGATELSEVVRSVIKDKGEGRELSKVGASVYVVGVFDTQESATLLAESLKSADSALTIAVKAL